MCGASGKLNQSLLDVTESLARQQASFPISMLADTSKRGVPSPDGEFR